MKACGWTAVVLIRCWYSLSGTPGTTRSETVALSSGSGVGQSVTMAVIAAAMAPTLRRAVLKRSSRRNIGLGVAGELDSQPARRPLACLALFLVIRTPLGQFRRKSSLIPGESWHVSVTMRVILLPGGDSLGGVGDDGAGISDSWHSPTRLNVLIGSRSLLTNL